MDKPVRAKATGPLKPQTIYDNIPRLVDILGDHPAQLAEVAELVDALDLGSSVL